MASEGEKKAWCASAKGQAATEMLVMVAFALIFILPLVFLFLSATGSGLSKTAISQAKVSARTIAEEAGAVYLQGEHAKKSILVNYPSGVINASAEGGVVAITLEQDGRRMDVVSLTFANISGNLSGKRAAGLQRINLVYVKDGNYVNVSYG
jgi:uncharacterized protein (UPF0333 family)